MPRKKKENTETVSKRKKKIVEPAAESVATPFIESVEPIIESIVVEPAVKKPKRAYKRKKKTIEEITVNAIVIAPKLSMCDGKKKRLIEKTKEQNGIRNI